MPLRDQTHPDNIPGEPGVWVRSAGSRSEAPSLEADQTLAWPGTGAGGEDEKGAQVFASASRDRRASYVMMTNSDNGWKVFFNETFVEIANRMLLG